MNKNTVHNFNLLIKNGVSTETSEDLTKNIIKELAEVSKEISRQKDIVQIWQEQNAVNTAIKNTTNSTGEGAFDTTRKSFSTTSSASETTTLNSDVSGISVSKSFDSTLSSNFNASIGGGASDTTERTPVNSFASTGNTPLVPKAENTIFDNSISHVYENINTKQMLAVPQTLQNNNDEVSVEFIKAEIKKKLDQAVKANDTETIQYWTRISKAFDAGATVADFDGKSDEMLFTEMYKALKKSKLSAVEIKNFNWEAVRDKMIKAIDANILKGSISKENKARWEIIKKQLGDDKANVANLFEQYDELFLLLKEVEGLEALPNTITITTKTKIYPNLSTNLYANIGKEDIYVFLKKINITDYDGSGVNKGAIKIKNTNATSFIVGESLDFFIDEAFINQEKHQKENINWMVYYVDKNERSVFKDKGTSLHYIFDKAGTYRIDAYGKNATVNGKKDAKESTFIELKIITEEIVITPPANIKKKLGRVSVEEQLFKISFKNPEIRTLNPVKLYYQIACKNQNKDTAISHEQELDSTGIVKLAMRNLGEYTIKVASKDQYNLIKNNTFKVIKNFVDSIDIITQGDINNDVYLWNETNRNAIFAAKTFKIENATQQEKENVKWLVYEENGKTYIPDGFKLQIENNEAGKQYLSKGETFVFPIPKKEGVFIVEAYSNIMEGFKSKSIKKIFVKHPKITEAFWTYNNGNKKKISGFTGEINHIKASIPGYGNQSVRIKFFLNDSKEVNYYNDTKTDGKGEINKKLKFDNALQKHFGIQNGKTAKIRFELEGVKNGKPYKFELPSNYETDTVISVTAEKKILDVYFKYNDSRVKSEDEVSFDKKGVIVTIVAKTQNMIGDEIILKAHKVGEKPIFSNKVKVNSDGIAATSFILRNLDKELKIGAKIKYYAGVEGYSTKHLIDKVLVMIVGDEKKKKIFNLTWGAKVSEDFRAKVIEICTELWPNNTMEMANGLMAVMYRETNKTFAANQMAGYKSLVSRDKMTKKHFENINKETGKMSSRAIGLIQFTQAALVSMKEFENGQGFDKLHELKLEYANMTEIQQLEKVKKYFKSLSRLPKVPEDIYVAVFSPSFVGRKNSETLYSKGTDSYKANPGLDKNNNGIQKSELLTKYYESLKEGNNNVNIAKAGIEIVKKEVVKKEVDESKFNNVRLHFTGATATEKSLSNKTKNILKEVGAKTKNFDIHITSTARNTYDQARIMYQNCSKAGGVRKQKKIYADAGDKVIDVYVAGIKAGNSKEEIIASMENKIKSLGPSTVSKHIADFKVMNTFDVSYSLLANKNDFLKEIQKRKELDKVLIENNCYHIQINQ